jgi:EAL domain-containing protein (putative c-di-GMP-specific phosphodiesterase class I)
MRWFQATPKGAKGELAGRADLVTVASAAMAHGRRTAVVAFEAEPARGASVKSLSRAVAERCARELDDHATLGRLGGLLFAVVLVDYDDEAAVLDLAYRLRTAVATRTWCGVATDTVLPPLANGEQLLGAGLLALTSAREAGDGHIDVCTPGHLAADRERRALGRDLGVALDEQGLEVNYQPIVNLQNGAVTGFEALVRWTHPEHGPIPAAEFVAVAEELGLIIELGTRVLSRATTQAQRWSAGNAMPIAIHVNVSGPELVDPRFVTRVRDSLRLSELPAEQLVVEFPAAVVERHLDIARAVCADLRRLGVRVAVEDVDPRSSLATDLATLDVAILKVDRRDLTSPEDAFALAGARGIAVYGEGIEDEAHRRRLLRYGCHVGQGYLFSRPLAAIEAERYLQAHLLAGFREAR